MFRVAVRRTARVIVTFALAGALVVPYVPFDVPSLRLAGVGLLWWYAALASGVGIVVTALALAVGSE